MANGKLSESCCCGLGKFLEGRPRGSSAANSKAAPRLWEGPLTKKQREKQEKEQHLKQNEEFQRRLRFLGKVPLFRQLPKDKEPLVAAACEDVAFLSGQEVIRQGEVGEDLFVICEGEAELITEGEASPQVLVQGDYFGERALLLDEPHASTVRARTRLRCCKITREKFQELDRDKRVHFADRDRRRKAVLGGSDEGIVTKDPTPKTPEDVKFLTDAMWRNETLKTLGILTDDRVTRMIDVAWREDVPSGEELIRAGQLQTDYFYIVQEGSFETLADEDSSPRAESTIGERAVASRARPESPTSPSSPFHMSSWTDATTPFASFASDQKSFGVGCSFGEISLLYRMPQSATVRAEMQATVWVVDRNSFKQILMQQSQEKTEEYVEYLEKMDILASLFAHERQELAEALEEATFEEGEVILKQGDAGSHFYILYDGKVSVTKDGKFVRSMQNSQTKRVYEGVFFGERALLKDEVRSATVTVTSPEAKVLCLHRTDFEILLGPVQGILDSKRKRTSTTDGKDLPRRLSRARSRAESVAFQAVRTEFNQIRKSDLRTIGLLGCGGFGKVELVESRSGKTFALKALSKGNIVRMNMQERTINEKEVLLMTDSAFIVRLYECYADSQYLYLLLEPCIGGELYETYKREALHGSHRHARFYAGSVYLAFEHLHERRIIYRDLKPENLLLTKHGCLKLTDMGLARFCVGKAFSIVGTPEYFGPEMITCSGHTSAVDWWTFGILIYEFLVGRTPFAARRSVDIYKRVMKGVDDVSWPYVVGDAGKDLIKSLLRKEPTSRLPMRTKGLERLKGHKWFGDMEWDKLKAGKLDPPYRPRVHHHKDLANFRARPDSAPQCVKYIDDGSGWDDDWPTVI